MKYKVKITDRCWLLNSGNARSQQVAATEFEPCGSFSKADALAVADRFGGTAVIALPEPVNRWIPMSRHLHILQCNEALYPEDLCMVFHSDRFEIQAVSGHRKGHIKYSKGKKELALKLAKLWLEGYDVDLTEAE